MKYKNLTNEILEQKCEITNLYRKRDISKINQDTAKCL